MKRTKNELNVKNKNVQKYDKPQYNHHTKPKEHMDL